MYLFLYVVCFEQQHICVSLRCDYHNVSLGSVVVIVSDYRFEGSGLKSLPVQNLVRV